MTVSYNVIGSTTTTNSISATSAASTSTAGQNLIGIFNESTGSNATTFNTIANMQNGYEGTQVGRTLGIYATAGSSTLVKNNIHNLSSASLVTSVASVSGVEMGGTAAINMVTETLIYNLSNTNSSFTGSLQESGFQVVLRNLVNRNFIRSISVHSSL
jgi:hypothetical protein